MDSRKENINKIMEKNTVTPDRALQILVNAVIKAYKLMIFSLLKEQYYS